MMRSVWWERAALGLPFSYRSVAGLKAEHDAAQGITLSGSTVSNWADQTKTDGTKKDAVGNTTHMPVYTASDAIFNGKPSIYFPTDKYLKTAAWTSPIVGANTRYTVCRFRGKANYQVLVDGLTALTLRSSGKKNLQYVLYSTGELTSADAASAAIVMCSIFNDAATKMFVNDCATPVITGNIGTPNLTGLMFGCNFYVSTDFANADLALNLEYAGEHDLATRQAIMRQLGPIYGVTVTG